jgi:hypothetical protein
MCVDNRSPELMNSNLFMNEEPGFGTESREEDNMIETKYELVENEEDDSKEKEDEECHYVDMDSED